MNIQDIYDSVKPKGSPAAYKIAITRAVSDITDIEMISIMQCIKAMHIGDRSNPMLAVLVSKFGLRINE